MQEDLDNYTNSMAHRKNAFSDPKMSQNYRKNPAQTMLIIQID